VAVGNLIKGKTMGGLVAYLLGTHDHSGQRRERAQVIGGTMSGTTKAELTNEFKAVTDLRPRLKKNVVHQSINFPDNERNLSDQELSAIGAHWAEGMGFEAYAIVSHGDHIHLACSRVKLDGDVVSDRHDFKKSEALIRQIEEKFDLVKVEASHLLEPENAHNHKRAITLQEISMIENGDQVERFQLTNLLDQTLEEATTATEFVELLEGQDIDVRPAFDGSGKLKGFSYVVKDNGAIFTSETLGRSYSYKNLLRKGLDYEPSRDRETLELAAERSRQRQADRDAEETGSRHDRDTRTARPSVPAPTGSPTETERRNTSHSHPAQDDNFDVIEDFDAADRPNGSNDRQTIVASGPDQIGDQQLEPRSPAGESRASGDIAEDKTTAPALADPEQPNPSSRSGAHTGRSLAGKSGGSSIAAITAVALEAVFLDGNDKDAAARFLRRWAAAWAKYMAATEKALRDAVKGYNGANAWKPNQHHNHYHGGRSYERITARYGTGRHEIRDKQITKQLDAMACHRYQVTITKGDQRYTATMTRQQIIDEQNKLARHNLRGANVHIRPAAREMADGNTRYEPLVLMTDLTPIELAKLRDAGVSLAITLREADDRISGWIRIGDQPVTANELLLAAKLIESRFGGTAAPTSQEGSRLAGFINQDVKRTDGRSPFIGLNTLDDFLTPATGTKFLMVEVRQRIARKRLACHVPGPAPTPPTPPYAC
jgi:hypothetical protein